MASVSSLGVGSGIDIASIVNDLIKAEGAGTASRLDRREVEYQAELTALGNLKSALAEFQSSYSGLLKASNYRNYEVNSSNSSLFTATTSGNIDAGANSIVVRQMAQGQSLATGAYTDVNQIIGTGTLTIDFGEYTHDVSDNVTGFTANAAKSSLSIDLTDASLKDVKDAINDANQGVEASIINDGSGYRLVLKSETGADNAMQISVTGDGDGNDTDGTGLSALTYRYDAATPVYNMTENLKAQDAIVNIDGIDVLSENNTITGAIENVTLELHSADPATTATLTRSITNDKVRDAVDEFVNGYNALMGMVKEVSYYDPERKEGGVLVGDASVRSIQTQLRTILNTTVSASPLDKYDSFASLGIVSGRDGLLEVDSVRLGRALSEEPDMVKRVLMGGALDETDQFLEWVSVPNTLKEGNVPIEVTQLASQGDYTGGAISHPPPAYRFDMSAGTYELQLMVDGIDSGLITIPNANYEALAVAPETGGSLVAQAIEDAVNASANLTSNGKRVTVSYEAPDPGAPGQYAFVIRSATYGSSSTLTVTSASADLITKASIGTAIGAATTGVDVEGLIGGVAATGEGQLLSGTEAFRGVAVNVLGGDLGIRDSIRYKEGLMTKLDTLMDSMLSSSGILAAKTTGINNSIDDINEQREKLATRLESLELRYIKQFSAMDALVAQLNSTSSFLAGQLANLPGARKADG